MMSNIQPKDVRVGVIYGGTSPERAGSLASGESASKALSSNGWNVTLLDLADIDITHLKADIDVAFLALHGPGGEDGKIQGALETLGIPYSGSGVMASAVGMHKPTFKKLATMNSLDTPRWMEVDRSISTIVTAASAGLSLGWPAFVKPTSGGGSLDASIVQNEFALQYALESCSENDYNQYIVEEYIAGTPCTVGLLEVGGVLQPLPVLTVDTDREFYDYTAKHDIQQRREQCPADLPPGMAFRLQKYAVRAHRMIGAHGVSRVDFLIGPNGQIAILEINTVPGLSLQGNLATMARAARIDYPQLVEYVLATAFTKPKYLP
ncbi:D-alanine--D-alanine ligase family protein [Actinocrispum wychmicini]|uniref:D-alanine--D-alanine ligase n=1 Tax=Actinocrispum wychmicini TaxID=1213861 RepID=A0A4R2J8N8_9PSEU|nr:D-alanine--D-alanine ligase [Actinocrispum wychmicini]TCO55663.1 D-alanine-D-alanine ligase [Actinocrispum wychmicini]